MKWTHRIVVSTASACAGAATLFAASLALPDSTEAAGAKRICVSWRHFQEERLRIDEAGIKSVLEPSGYTYASTDAQSEPTKQLTDVETLLASGCSAIIINPQDAKAILPAIALAKKEGVPVVSYDGVLDTPDVVFSSFKNFEVGRLMADAMVKVRGDGNWVLIEGDATHPIVADFRAGQMEVLKPLIDKGAIKIVAQQNIENWKTDVAQTTMEQILTKQNNKVDSVLAMSDGVADGVAAALAEQGLLGIPLSGQDGNKSALNRIAKGQQVVTIWKNSFAVGQSAAKTAIELAEGRKPTEVTGVTMLKTASGYDQPAVLLSPVAITRDNLDKVLDAKWITKETLCLGVKENPPPACK
jgi:D-xylose transport system substrate-binding protein